MASPFFSWPCVPCRGWLACGRLLSEHAADGVHDEEPVHGCRVSCAVRPYMANGDTLDLEGLPPRVRWHSNGSFSAHGESAVVNEPLQSPLKNGSGRDTIIADPPVL